MHRRPPSAWHSVLVLVASLAAGIDAGAQAAAQATFDSAYFDWETGEYPRSLERLERLLTSPGGERVLDEVALLTGELYATTEVAPDGQRVRWSLDGRHASYTTGSGAARSTHIVEVDDGRVRAVARLAGHTAAFSPDGNRMAYLRLEPSPTLDAARAELDRLTAAGDLQNARRQRFVLEQLEAEEARVRIRELRSGQEREVPASDLAKWSLVFGGDGTLLMVASRREDPSRTDIYSLDVGGSTAPRALTEGPGLKGNPTLTRNGSQLVYAAAPASIVLRGIASGESRTFQGEQHALSRDESMLAFVGRAGAEHTITVVPLSGGSPAVVVRTTRPLANPALSPNGRRIAYQMMPREDWELYVVASDGTGERRLTNEIQHDLFPQFLSGDRILAVMGESRHRRSYLYDTGTGARTRLFHNNTVRTVAPEYEWAASADGRRVLIIAERDGDTVSPERGVYLTDLSRRVTLPEVLARVRASLAAERSLRERGAAMFTPIADRVREVVADVSVPRIYSYARTLHDFGSKYVTQPGNRKAIDYLAATLRSFGYEPELQWFEPRPGVRTANVIATLRGTRNPELIYVVSSHFDSVEEGPGADDNSSGTTALLDAARVLASRPMPATIKFAFFTGEEAGLLGSREFVRRAVASDDRIVGALNNDMIGWTNDHRLDNTIRYSNEGIRDLQHAAAFLFTDLITYDAKYYKSTDAHAYYEVYGDIVGGIGSYPILGTPHYHQPHDVLETINHRLVAEVSRTTVASVMLLASSPARLTRLQVVAGPGGVVEVRWAPAAERGPVTYRVTYGPAEDPARHAITVSEPRAVLRDASPGMRVAVKALAGGSLEGWDWARGEVGAQGR